jgi:integrase
MVAINKLTSSQVKFASKKGLLSDGGGLYLQIGTSGTKSWVYRFKLKKVRHEMGLGSLMDYSLSEARERRDTARKLKSSGINPIDHRNQKQSDAVKMVQATQTFKQCAEQYILDQQSGWKNEKHIQQWTNTLVAYAYPICGDLQVDRIDSVVVSNVLKPIWETKTETATRVRSRIELILDWAKVKGYRSGENPARWRESIKHILPDPKKVRKVKHHPSLDYKKTPAFMELLKQNPSRAARAVEFLILSGARTGEVRLATWDEISFEDEIWTIPGQRMKGGVEHVVPLGVDCLNILQGLPKVRGESLIFPGARPHKPFSDMTLLKLTKVISQKEWGEEITNHGFRATFRMWAGEETDYARDVIEFSLAHKLKDKTEAAYFRSNLLKKRRELMRTWAEYCCGKPNL